MELTNRQEMTESYDRNDRNFRGERNERSGGGIDVKIVEHIGVLSETKGWRKELNIVSWNKMPPKFDIREWDEYHEHMRKGLTFTKSEIRELRAMLKEIDLSMKEVPEMRGRRKKEEPLTAVEKQAISEGFTEHVPF